MAHLQARVDCLLKDNGELKNQVKAKEVELREVEALKVMVEVELVVARRVRDEVTTISRMFQDFVGNSGNVINKARLYDQGMNQSGALTRRKIVRFLVDYNTKMEKLVKGMRALLQPAGQQQSPKLAKQSTPSSVTTPTVQPNERATTTGTADPTL